MSWFVGCIRHYGVGLDGWVHCILDLLNRVSIDCIYMYRVMSEQIDHHPDG